MRKLIFILVLGLVLGIASYAFAEPLLPEILDHIYGAGNYVAISNNADQFWYSPIAGTGYAEAKFAEWSQTFGYIDSSLVFHGLMDRNFGGGYLDGNPTTTFPVLPGTFQLADRAIINETPPPQTTYTWGSLPSYNTDGYDHMWTYQITGGTGGNTGGNPVGDYVVCWEDTPGGGDQDHQDFVVQIHGLAPVPEPASMVLLGLGVLGLFGLKRRKVA